MSVAQCQATITYGSNTWRCSEPEYPHDVHHARDDWPTGHIVCSWTGYPQNAAA